MNDRYILNDQGEPVPCEDLMAWARWYEENRSNRIVKQDTVRGWRVSTVFLALDHSFGGSGPPLLWETMVFRKKGKRPWQDVYMRRYASREEAVAGHAEILDRAARTETVKEWDAETGTP